MIDFTKEDIMDLTGRDVVVVIEGGLGYRGTFGNLVEGKWTTFSGGGGRLLLKNVYVQEGKSFVPIKSFSNFYIDLSRIMFIQTVAAIEAVKIMN